MATEALAQRLRPCAILLDVKMPGVDGWSVLSELKANSDLATIPVIMITSVDQRSLAASLGATDYMLKPVRWDRFSKVMDRFRTGFEHAGHAAVNGSVVGRELTPDRGRKTGRPLPGAAAP